MGTVTCNRCGRLLRMDETYGQSMIPNCIRCRSDDEEIEHRNKLREMGVCFDSKTKHGIYILGKTKLRLTDEISVELTQAGNDIALADDLIVDVRGFLHCNLWSFMRTFGPHMWADDSREQLFRGEFIDVPETMNEKT